MKTTIDLSDALLLQAKSVARAQGQTLRALMEQGLQMALEQQRKTKAKPHVWKDLSVEGTMSLEMQEIMHSGNWARLRDEFIYPQKSL